MIADGPGEADVDAVLAGDDGRRTYVFTPRGVGDGTPAIRASLAGVGVHLRLEGRWPDGVLERLVDHYLHHPDLETPIEPFAAVAHRIAAGRGTDLNDLGGELLGRDYFVDRKGRVSLAERWAKAGLFFGTTRDDPETFGQTELWRRVAGRKGQVFTTMDGCATCPHYHVCGGYLRALDDEDEVCAAWRAAFDQIAAAWRSIRP